MINEEKLPDTVFPQIMRNTEQRNGGNDSLRNENLKLKPPDLVLVAVGAEGVDDQEHWRRHTDHKEDDPRDGGAKRRVLTETEKSEERFEFLQG